MSSTPYLALRNVSTFTASTINAAKLSMNSTTLSLGTSAGATKTNFSNGSYAAGSWITAKTGLANPRKIGTSSTGQYQLVTSGSTPDLWLSSDSGATWSQLLSATTGLPTLTGTAYWSAGSISASGQHILLSVYGGSLWMSQDYGRTFATTAQPTPDIWLQLNGNTNDSMGGAAATATGTPSYVTVQHPGYVDQAINLSNFAGQTATRYVRGTWTGSSNFTVSFWFNSQSVPNTGQYQCLFASYQGQAFIGLGTSGAIYANAPIGGLSPTIGSTTFNITQNTWYYVTYIYQSNGLCSFYVNNTLIASITNTQGTGVTTSSFGLGTFESSTTLAFNGYIADFRIYNSAIPYVAVPHLAPNVWLPMETPAQEIPVASTAASLTTSTIYLPLDGSVADAMGVSTVTATGSPAYLSATHWGATSQVINLANTAGGTATQFLRGTWSGAPNFSVSFWFNPQSIGATQMIFCMGNASFGGELAILINSSNQVYANIPSGGGFNFSTITTSYTISTNTWYYVTLIFQTSGICALYINNTIVGSIINTNGLGSVPNTSFSFGTYPNQTPIAFNGYLNDVRIYNYAITYLPLATSTIHLPLNGAVTDARGFSTVTAEGSPTYVDANRVGYTGQAINLLNTAGGTATRYVRGTWAGATNFTVSFWMNPQTVNGTTQILFGAYLGAILLYINTSNQLVFQVPTGSGAGLTSIASSALSVNTWYYVTAIFQSNNTCSFYLNNALVGSYLNTGGFGSFSSSALFSLGCQDNATVLSFNGYIDDFRIWNATTVYSPVPLPVLTELPPLVQNLGSTADPNPTVALTFEGTVNNSGTSASNSGTLTPNIWLPFDGSTADITGTSTITPTGSFTYVSPARAGVTGTNAINLANTAGSAASNYIRGSYVPPSNFTVSFWMNPQSLGAQQTVFQTGNGGYAIYLPNTNLISIYRSTIGNVIATSFAVTTNTWYHIYATFNAGGTGLFYVNGILIGSYSCGVALGSSVLFALGTEDISNTFGFNGYIDDLRIYNSVVNYNPGGFVTGAVTYVPGTVGTTAVNLANTAGGTATNYIRSAWTSPASYTVTGWFNLQSYAGSGWQNIFSTGGMAGPNAVVMGVANYAGNNNVIVVQVPDSQVIGTAFTPALNTWYYFSFTIQPAGGICSLTINNTTYSVVATSTATPSGMFGLGTFDSGSALSAFNGYLDDIKIYNHEISIVGSVPRVPGIIGSQALNLVNTAGTNAGNYIQGSFSGPNAITMSGWFNIQSYPPSSSFSNIACVGDLTVGTFLSVGYNNNISTDGFVGIQLSFLDNTTTSRFIGRSVGGSLNTWYHFYVIYQQSGTCYAYLNGALIGTVAGAPFYQNAIVSAFTLGRNVANNAVAFNGYIDDLRIYNAAIPFHALFPQNFRSVALSGSGQYALAAAASGWVVGSATSGQTWTKQAVCVGTQGDLIQPNKTGLAQSTWEQAGVNWTVTGSSKYSSSGFEFNHVFDTNVGTLWDSASTYISPTGVYNGSVTTNVQGGIGTVPGEWIQLQSNSPIILQSYQFIGASHTQLPKTYYIVGSNDGSTWHPVQYVSITSNPFNNSLQSMVNNIIVNYTGTQTLQGVITGYAITTSYSSSSTPYFYFRLIGLTSFSATEIGFATFIPNFARPSPSALALSYSGQYQLVATNSVAGNVMPNQTGLATSTWTQGGVTWGATQSSVYNGTYPSYRLYTNSPSEAWLSGSVYNTTSGVYTGSVSTTVLGGIGAISGEWVQIQSSVPLVLQSYIYADGGYAPNVPKVYYIVGSMDGSNWYPLQYVFMNASPFSTTYTTPTNYIITNTTGTITVQSGSTGSGSSTAYSTTTQPYIYFRMIITNVWGSNAGYCEFTEWYLNFANSVSYSSNSGTTWSNTAGTVSNESVALSPSGQYALSTNTVAPLARLTLDNTAADSQGALVPATGAGTVTYSTAIVKTGTAAAFFNNTAGSTSPSVYLNYTVPVVLNTPSAMTMACWFYATGLPTGGNTAIPVGFNHNGTSPGFLFQMNNLGVMYLTAWSTLGSNPSVLSASSLQLNTWYHLVGTFSPGIITLHINGVLQGTAPITGNLAASGPLNMTNLYVGAAYNTWGAFAGYVDDVRIYTQALSAHEIAALYANPVLTQSIGVSNSYLPITSYTKPILPGATANVVDAKVSQTGQYMVAVLPTATVSPTAPLARLTLDNTAADAQGALTPTTGAGTVTYSTAIKQVGTHSAFFNQTMGATPPTVYLNYTLPGSFGLPTAGTFSCWIYPLTSGVTGGSVPLGFGTTATNITYFANSGLIQIYYSYLSGSVTSTSFGSSTGAAPANTWTHIAVTFGSGSIALYINGVLVSTGVFAGSLCLTSGSTMTNMFVGALSATNNAFAGYVDDVRLYTTALSPTEVYALYAGYPTNNNVYYSIDSGATFTGLSLGSSPMAACSISYDGSYLTATNQAGTIYTLNRNSSTFALALGNQAGQINQASNAIAIGNQAGQRNQAANSIVLNASGSAVTATNAGFYVSPIAQTSGLTMELLGYGSDSQIVRSGVYVAPGGNLTISRGVFTNDDYSLMLYYENTYQTFYDWAIGPHTINGQAVFNVRGGGHGPIASLSNYFTIHGNGGGVGIGTTNPSGALNVYRSGASSFPSIIVGSDQTTRVMGIAHITTAGAGVTGSQLGDAMINVESPTAIGDGGKLHLCRTSTFNAVMTVVNTGNVGIGITNPSATLHVNGNTLSAGILYTVQFTVTLSATGTVTFIANSPSNPYMFTALWLVTAHSGNSNQGGTTNSATAYMSMNSSFPTLMNVFGGTSSNGTLSIVGVGYGAGLNSTSTGNNGTYTVSMIRLI